VYKVKVLNDADTPGKGEITLRGFAYDEWFDFTDKKAATGDYIYTRWNTARRGVGPRMPLAVQGVECDSPLGCRSGNYSADVGWATTVVDVDHPGSDPSTSRQPLGNMPAGHFGYTTFEMERNTYLKFRVYAYWDVMYLDD
jgi:hypothetical protein